MSDPSAQSRPGAGTPERVLLAGGGSAGHVSPLLALADALRRRNPGIRIEVLGTSTGLEARLVPDRGYELRTIPKVVFPRRPSAQALRLPSSLWGAVAATDAVLRDLTPQVVVGFGGYVSTPAYLAARRRGIPIVVHEQNARPGLANKLGARLTRHVAVTFADTPLAHGQVVGMPLRREISDLNRDELRAQAREFFGLHPTRTTLLVTGGSLGAARLNGAFAAAAADLAGPDAPADLQVLHLSGNGKEFEPVGVQAGRYVVRPYAQRMELAYAAADLVVARSGANTVCELTAVGLPALFVPLPIGNGEQRLNAEGVVAAGGATLTPDDEVDAAWVRSVVVPLLADPRRVAAMAAASASVGERHADERLADVVDRAWSAQGEDHR
ncbi:UDP-N-acetylglucosamine--N-acetylmuramyl-(pentapeptide) pyrophosphoryl-undecaprenol N-acetylglucosamine transferase [Kineosphaera limosa]|uniref:UDP-N-acetylglucosamine--N-acetylmuramyl-(pentapeptide) pyrophosphoryl-undecaprenol N-acetylglucosamine transferase n=1 Tax=Kineosphaera limosa NBRC 100340 TaxID=1184609 RepID=K6XBZ1_9MICO|nr:undecaprenyldiphospho-muramoylpentapeptide beta-N-acetylglucosaminyltransferase [Kineosphaera limosa]NYD99261.1 UDP-N-acetylglucosamine--N-acetylmuramyl-(pentapeptide) pyrophosphoryl-undecaprenol N-acetylglucosamine transferase [Kineosphaera limosa]GAB96299.1 UDP-N-acetylglucosamine--N-acetylmuramyl-(pentapeptide) pyrophosphoryl-undecaprenol N-acetylglucosamine transferase [Kineosphaera limosa NBRC 100340]